MQYHHKQNNGLFEISAKRANVTKKMTSSLLISETFSTLTPKIRPNVPTIAALSTVDSEFQSKSSRNLVNDILPWHFLRHRQEQHQLLSPKQVTGMWSPSDILLPQTDCVNPFWKLFLGLYYLNASCTGHSTQWSFTSCYTLKWKYHKKSSEWIDRLQYQRMCVQISIFKMKL